MATTVAACHSASARLSGCACRPEGLPQPASHANVERGRAVAAASGEAATSPGPAAAASSQIEYDPRYKVQSQDEELGVQVRLQPWAAAATGTSAHWQQQAGAVQNGPQEMGLWPAANGLSGKRGLRAAAPEGSAKRRAGQACQDETKRHHFATKPQNLSTPKAIYVFVAGHALTARGQTM
eukprot:SM000046S16409  [mRNA]  locus=s46:487130:487938:- [translate_table: standard]